MFLILKLSQEWIVLQLNLKNNCCFKKWGVAAKLLTTNLAQISSWNQYNMLFFQLCLCDFQHPYQFSFGSHLEVFGRKLAQDSVT